MVETRHILPPEAGPTSDPVLYGVAEALACLFPIDERHVSRPCSAARVSDPEAGSEAAVTAAPAEIETA